MKPMTHQALLFTGLLSSALMLSACETNNNTSENNANNTENDEENNELNDIDTDGGEPSGDGEIEIGLNNWAENVAVANMWAIVLEEEGYDVELIDHVRKSSNLGSCC